MSDQTRIVIVGGVAGGASAAARARRVDENAQITMIERGGDISFANCGMPYHIGGAIADRKRLLVQTAGAFKRRFNVDVRTGTQAIAIDRRGKSVEVVDLASKVTQKLPYDKLILSPGAEPVRPPIPGLNGPSIFTLRSLADMDAIKTALDARAESAVIVGGGYIGLEMAEALRTRDLAVTLVELASQVFGALDPEMAQPLQEHLAAKGVSVVLGASVTRIEHVQAASGQLPQMSVLLSTGKAIPCQIVIVAVGVAPEVRLAREAGLAIGERGGIVVDDHMRTSDPDVFAVGDAVEVTDLVGRRSAVIPLAGPASRQGRIAADNALGRDSVYRDTQGTAICKVFDLTVGMTGASEKVLRAAGKACEKVYVHPASHASYYPGASPISLKLLFDPAGGRILGAQAVGTSGVDKRIDVLATAIRAGMTVMDLQDLELSYAPPYGSARDVINYAGFVASNALKGDVRLFHAHDATSPGDDQLLLDVRTPAEVQAGTIPGSVNIPLDDLRSRLDELPRDRELLVFCQVGLRGYLACRLLSQKGFACRNLSGGYKTYKMCTQTVFEEEHSMLTRPQEMRDDAGAAVQEPQCFCCAPAEPPAAVKNIDVCGLQCPGPIMRLREELESVQIGQVVSILANDNAFARDVAAWCHSTGNTLMHVAAQGSATRVWVKRQPRPQPQAAAGAGGTGKTIVVFSDDLDKVMAALVIANGAAAMGSEVTLFFTFWGLNVLRKDGAVAARKTFIERMFGWMMPRGAGRLKLSKMNMGGLGTAMMKGVMKKKNVSSLEELLSAARTAGVKLVACTMSMDVMGIKPQELIDGVETGGVAMYLDQAQQSNVNLFV